MLSRLFAALLGLVMLPGVLLGFEVQAKVKKVDAEKGAIIVFAGGQDRNLKVAKEAKFLDEQGKPLADGLAAKEIMEGAAVTITVEPGGGGPVLHSLQLGNHGGNGRPQGPPEISGKTSVGFKPLNEMSATDKYKGEEGGLYGGGTNEPPAAHREAAEKELAKIVPVDAHGKPAANGKIVLVSISMSNATQEFSRFKQIADADPQKSPLLTIVDCAQGGQAMAQWTDPNARPWQVAMSRIEQAGVVPEQVQVAWVKLANVGPTGELKDHCGKLVSDTTRVLQNAKAKFPNLRIAYLDSRIYAGYATTRLNPEPYAYEGAFAVRWLIQDQIKRSHDLNFDPQHGEVKSPLLLWGAYLWADGTTMRKSDGLNYTRDDFAADGTHPSNSGREKVAQLLLSHFKTDSLSKPWFVGGKIPGQ
jgi:hypothetical protein